jgi:hypothetical protein
MGRSGVVGVAAVPGVECTMLTGGVEVDDGVKAGEDVQELPPAGLCSSIMHYLTKNSSASLFPLPSTPVPQSQCAASSNATLRAAWTHRVTGSNTLYALVPYS